MYLDLQTFIDLAPIVPPDGPEPCDLVACGEAPGAEEERQGRGWVGPAGRILWGGDYDLIGSIVGRPRDTVRCTNVVKNQCPDVEWQQWHNDHKEAIYADLRAEVAAGEPKLVLAFGRRACTALVPAFRTITEDHGKPRRGYGNYIVLPLWNPSASLRGNSKVIPALASALSMVPMLLEDAPMCLMTTDRFLEREPLIYEEFLQ